jgi:hypothetical protein
MTGPAECRLLGCWRITDSDLRDQDCLDLVAPAAVQFQADGRGSFAFGALEAGMTLEYSPTIVFFHLEGFDEGDEIRGTGSAELMDDGSLEIELSFFDSDDAVLTARRE